MCYVNILIGRKNRFEKSNLWYGAWAGLTYNASFSLALT
jgi:hypothetical protein